MKAALVLAALLVLPTVAAEPYLSEGGDASRSAWSHNAGPEALDVAYWVELPGGQSTRHPALMAFDGAAYAWTSREDATNQVTPTFDGDAILYRLDIDSGDLSVVVDAGSQVVWGGIATDMQRFFVVLDAQAYAYSLAGDLVWGPVAVADGVDAAHDEQYQNRLDCGWASVIEGTYVVACLRSAGWQVTAIDAATGSILWTATDVTAVQDLAISNAFYIPSSNAFAIEGAASSTHVYVVPTPSGGGNYGQSPDLVAIDLATGTATDREALSPPGNAFESDTLGNLVALSYVSLVALSDGVVVSSFGQVERLRVADGTFSGVWTRSLVAPSLLSLEGGLAVGPHSAWAGIGGSLYSLSLADGVVNEESDQGADIGRPDTLWGNGATLWTLSTTGTIHAVDATTGLRSDTLAPGRSTIEVETAAPLDDHLIAYGRPSLALAPTSGDGDEYASPRLVVIGQAAAGIQLAASLGDPLPAPGADVVVDATGTEPGRFAPDLTFSVDWGDGNVDEGSDPRFEHAYVEPGFYEVTLRAGNSAGQEASQRWTVEVGGHRPNFFETAFSADNQETTFFLLGLIATLLFAAFGVLKLRRKRSILRRELEKADDVVQDHKHDPDTLRDGLRDHRLRARRLFLAGRLDEGSTSLLERHIDELLRDHRLSSVEADLAFLPHGLFRSMQEMLRDARVTQLERNNFLVALDAEKALTGAQKKRVRTHVETWHREDAA